MKNIIKKYIIKKREEIEHLKCSNLKMQVQLKFLSLIKSENFSEITRNLKFSNSQFLQDLFVLNSVNFKKDGYFVEFGATNGVDLSNTYLLEKKFGWRGILAEPCKSWHAELNTNRSCFIEKDCVYNKTGDSINFLEAEDGNYSVISKYSNTDTFGFKRRKAKEYTVNTISLVDLLLKYDSPRDIDYLSIDTEGSEYEILKGFDFNKYCIKLITCEHNYGDNRDNIHRLMSRNGYYRVYKDISYCDDWYIKK